MIDVVNLVKKYSGVEAVKGISFQVTRGEIVGFLGPNGAGKSTTMRMLTGYLPASAGSIKIAGLDLADDSIKIRSKIGYMPENVPLYLDMRVREYLQYRAALKGVGSRTLKSRVSDVMHRCGVFDVGSKIIGTLSKGYRQRVGLADALVHDPDLLILDEPTAGLDPNQIRTVRDLIKDLGKSHTILLSTHILSEVEAVCGRAIIIHRGKIEASDTLENLRKKVQSGGIHIEVKAAESEALPKLKALAKLSEATVTSKDGEWVHYSCTAAPGEDITGAIDNLVKENRWPLREFRREKATMEDVFVELTQD